MRKLYSLGIGLGCLAVATSASATTLESAVQRVFSDARYIQLSTSPDAKSCNIASTADTVAKLESSMLVDCNLRLQVTDGWPTEIYAFPTNKSFHPVTKSFVKYDGSLLEYIKNYLPFWELRGKYSNEIYLPERWRTVSMQALQSELGMQYETRLQSDDKRFYVLEQKADDDDALLQFGIFFPFEDLNQDFYELVKGYFNSIAVVRYERDNRAYLKISASEESRESLSKTYIYMKAVLRDKWTKAQKLGGFFPEEERQNLKLLYLLINQAEIKSFYGNELVGIHRNELQANGLEVYRKSLRALEKSDAEQIQRASVPPVLPGTAAEAQYKKTQLQKSRDTTDKSAPRVKTPSISSTSQLFGPAGPPAKMPNAQQSASEARFNKFK